MPRGRPPKVHSNDPNLNELLKLPWPSWDFTDNPLYDGDNKLVEHRLAEWQRWCCPDGCKMLKIAEEVAPKTGKFHGQGRIIFRRKYRRAQLQKLWPDVHWEPTKANKDQLYLMKPYTHLVVDYDDRHQGIRNVFAEQKEAIVAGANIRDCSSLEGANYQSIRSAEILMTYFEPERPPDKRYVYLVADGTATMPTDVYRLNHMSFWNGYDAHDNVYINQKVCKLTMAQLRMVSGNAPFRVGRGRQARFSHVYMSGLDEDERKALDLLPCGRRATPMELLGYRR